MWNFVVLAIVLLLGTVRSTSAIGSVSWWVTDVSQKVTSLTAPPAGGTQPLHLHSARQEFAPFQIIVKADETTTLSAPVLNYDESYFTVQVYEQFFVPLQHVPEPEIFSLVRLTDTAAVADGLRPVSDLILISPQLPAAFWVDVYLKPEAPPGDHTVSILVPGHGEQQNVIITVYPVDLQPTAAMNIIIPLEADWTIPFFAQSGNPDDFQRQVNQLMIDHSLVPGTLTGLPSRTGSSWDFSAFDAELDALPPGTVFYTPLPYDEWNDRYLIADANGNLFPQTQFDNPEFTDAVYRFFADLADYLEAKGRLGNALVYPVDETRWVADEPDHNGPEGYVRLADWTHLIRAAGLRVSASRVTPATYAPGWMPTNRVADDVHVHVDLFDAAPDLYTKWGETDGQSTSLYLNEYGDLIDMPASVHRGLIWHAYGRGIRTIAGYAAMEWVDADYELLNPWISVMRLYPQSGYGGGALIWPGPQPSVRIKLLREGVEDARLLDMYAQITSEPTARKLAEALTPSMLADQKPPPMLWDTVHTALLVALTNGTRVDARELYSPPVPFSEIGSLIEFSNSSVDRTRWEWGEAVSVDIVDSPWEEAGNALEVRFGDSDEENHLLYWLGDTDLTTWDALQFDVKSQSEFFTELDIGVGDADGNHLLLRNGAVLVGPETQRTLTLPLVIPFGEDEPFNWAAVTYFELSINTTIVRVDGFGQERAFELGGRTLIFDNFRLAR